MAFRARKLSGAFEKRASGQKSRFLVLTKRSAISRDAVLLKPLVLLKHSPAENVSREQVLDSSNINVSRVFQYLFIIAEHDSEADPCN